MPKITGTFEVKMIPQPGPGPADGVALQRLLLDKHYLGPLQASGEGQMLGAMTPVKGSAGYVAIERVAGTLGGRAGSFVLQHHGLMNRGVPSLSVTVVPDSGLGDLQGLSGRMDIRIESGQHFYDFEYSLPAG